VILIAAALRHGALWWGLPALDVFAVFVIQPSAIYNLPGVVRRLAGGDLWPAGAVLASTCLIVSLQIAGGAYRAEFDVDPDESAHFVSGLMLYDYLAAMPRANPIVWAEQYYLHYPKVAIGHWPPGLYVLEAAWWMIFPPSRWSILWLEAALVSAAALVFFRLARRLGPPWLALGATLLLAASPVVQQSADMAMADALCLVWSVLLADACVRLVDRPTGGRLTVTGLWLACALLTKGTGACLVAAPAIALAVTGQWKQLPRAAAAGCFAAVLAIGFGWYAVETAVLHHSLLRWGGVTTSIPWPIVLLPGLAGWGICLLAVAGMVPALAGKRPAALAAASILLATVAVSYGLRAMNQPRHWIIVLPAMLLLSVESLFRLWNWKAAAVAAAAVALWLFPWSVYRQAPGELAAMARQLPRPARILVSSSRFGEGAMIAAIALSEPRPSSVVVRASQSLASSGSNGEDYRLTAASPEAVALRLDEMGIDKVELHTQAGDNAPAHHRLLLETLRGSSSWRECAAMETLEEWCRVLKPAVARKPLRIDLTSRIGAVIQEQ
jgi:hypothetical protein